MAFAAMNKLLCEVNMSPLEIGLNLNSDITEEDGNNLAREIIQSEHSKNRDSATNICFALYNIGQYRLTGVGFPNEVSDLISDWIEEYFDENDSSSEKMADIVFELTSEKSDELVQRLFHSTTNEYLKATLLEAISYKGT